MVQPCRILSTFGDQDGGFVCFLEDALARIYIAKHSVSILVVARLDLTFLRCQDMLKSTQTNYRFTNILLKRIVFIPPSVTARWVQLLLGVGDIQGSNLGTDTGN